MAKGRNTAALAGLTAAMMMDDADKKYADKVLGEAGKTVGGHLLAAGRNPIKYGRSMLGLNAPEEEPARMAKGGSASMKRMASGGMSDADKAEIAAYRKKPEYTGYEDYAPSGRAALRYYNQEAEKTDIKDYVKRKDGPPYNPTVAKKAQAVQREVMNEGRRETRGTVPAEALKKGGSVSASSRADGCAQRGKTRGKFV